MYDTRRQLNGLILRVLVTTIVFTSAFFAVPPESAKAAGSVRWGASGKRAGSANLAVGTSATLEDFENHSDTSGPLVQLSTGDYVTGWSQSEGGSGTEVRAQKLSASGARLWGENGVFVASHSSIQLNGIVTDASGNSIFIYTRSGSVEIYAQKLNADGVVQWAAGGLPVANEGSISEQEPAALADGSGGVYVAYRRNSGTSADIRAQRLNSSGAKQCGTNGTAVGAAANGQFTPSIVTDGSTGAIITWTDQRSGSDIYAQKINTSCAAQWTANGVAIGTATGNQDQPAIIADGSSGAVLTWRDARGSGNSGIYAQKVNSSGTVQWTANGVALFTTSGTLPTYPHVTTSATNVMIAFTREDTDGDLYVSKLNASGAKLFGDGIKAADAATEAGVTKLLEAGDGSTDVIIVWNDESGVDRQVKAQRVSANGDMEWTANGSVLLQTFTSFEFSNGVMPYAITNSVGDVIVAANSDDGPGLLDINLQRGRASDGAPQWNSVDGVNMPNGASGEATQMSPDVDHDGTHSYVAWIDKRRDPNGDVYVQKFDVDGSALWTSGGVPVDVTANDVFDDEVRVRADGSGGAYAIWLDSTSGGVRVLRIDSTGAVAGGWSSSGITISPTTGGVGYLSADRDGLGGLVVSWNEDNRVGANRVNGSGSVLWSATGTYLNAPSSAGGSPPHQIVSDGAGGAFAVYHHNDGVSVSDLRVIRLSPSNGATWPGWDTFGTIVTSNDLASYPDIALDGSSGIVVAWEQDDGGTGSYGIATQRYNGSGNALWTAGGVVLANDDPLERQPEVVNSGSGGAIVVWGDSNTTTYDLHAQRLSSSGVPQWTAGGVKLTHTSGEEVNLATQRRHVDTDGAGGAVVGFQYVDYLTNTNGDIRAQRVDVDGNVRWGSIGLLMAGKATDKTERKPSSVGDGNGGIITAFIQQGSPEQISIQYAQDAPLGGGGSGSSESSSTITNVKSDTMSRLKISTASDHTIRQTLPPTANFDSTSSTDILAYDFPSGFTLSGTWVTGDFTFNDGAARTVDAVAQGAGTTTVSCSNGANNVGVAIDTTAKVFRVRPCGASYASSTSTTTVTFRILGSEGDGVLTNPSSAGINEVVLSMDDEGSADAFLTDLSVYIMDDDQVNITADVNATLAFDIDIQTTCGAESAAPYAVALGTLTTSAVTTSASKICLDLDTNAAGGAVVTVQGSGSADGLESAAAGDSIVTAYASGAGGQTTLAAGTDGFGLCVESVSAVTGSATGVAPYNGACGDTSHIVGGADSAAPQQILTTNDDPLDGTANNTAALRVKAAVSTSAAAANDYTDTLTFIATGTF